WAALSPRGQVLWSGVWSGRRAAALARAVSYRTRPASPIRRAAARGVPRGQRGIDPAAGRAETPARARRPPHGRRRPGTRPTPEPLDGARPAPHPRRTRRHARGPPRPRRLAGGAAARLRHIELPLAPRGPHAGPAGAHGLRARPLRLRRVGPPVGRRLRPRG